jgi:hypothetical protein
VTSVIGGLRTLAQWQDYWGALNVTITQEDEDFVNQLVSPGHSYTPRYNDPSYPLSAREYPITYPMCAIQNSIIGISQFGGFSHFSSLIPT